MSESRSPDEEENKENNENIGEKIISYGKKIIKKMQGWDGKVSRAQIWALIIFGILFLLIGSLISTVISYLGLLLIVAGLYLGLKSGGILRKEQVLDSWGMLIENGQGNSNEVFQATSDFIMESNVPSLRTRKEKMSPGVVGSIMGTKREFLIVKDQQSSLSPYQIFVGVRTCFKS